MILWQSLRFIAALACLGSVNLVAIAWAHHPMPQPQPGAASPWPVLWLLGAGIFVVTFVVTFAVLSLLERRQRVESHTRQSVRR
jgi:hypothetical protein